mgnify:CR=1 FL=1
MLGSTPPARHVQPEWPLAFRWDWSLMDSAPKTRAEVARTGKKMYSQKGTGNARHGDRSVPSFVGGGVGGLLMQHFGESAVFMFGIVLVVLAALRNRRHYPSCSRRR